MSENNEDMNLSSEELYEKAPCGYIFTDSDGLLLKVNGTFAKWVDQPKLDIVRKKRFQDLLTVGSKIYYETHYSPLLKMQGFLNEITLDLVGQQYPIPVLISSVVVKDETGKVLYVKSTVFNIFERRRYERDLLISRKKAEASANRFELLAQVGERLQHLHDVESSLQEIADFALTNFCDICTIDLKSIGGNQRIATAARHNDIKIPEVTPFIETPILIQDADEHKPLQNAMDVLSALIVPFNSGMLAFYHTQLGKRFDAEDLELAIAVAKRLSTALELSELQRENAQIHEELKKTVQDLRHEKRIREIFVATITHDLRSPLTSVKLSLQIMQRKSHDQEQVDKISSKCLKSVIRLDRMIEDLLHANRLSAGEKLIINMEKFDMVALAKDVISDMTLFYGDRIVLDAPSSIIGKWDQDGLRRILENLCTNAIKYGLEEAPIEVQLKANENSLFLSVHNQGDPIPDEDQKKLFEPYKRMEIHEHTGKKGWGLGLAFVKGLVEAHQGNVRVISQLGFGTSFEVILPIS